MVSGSRGLHPPLAIGGCLFLAEGKKPPLMGEAFEVLAAYSGMGVSGVACTLNSGAGGSWTCTGGVREVSSFLRARVTAAFLALARRVRVFAAFLPAARDLPVEATFFAAAWRRAALRFRVAAAFRPAVLRMGLMFPPASSCGTALNLKFIRHASMTIYVGGVNCYGRLDVATSPPSFSKHS